MKNIKRFIILLFISVFSTISLFSQAYNDSKNNYIRKDVKKEYKGKKEIPTKKGVAPEVMYDRFSANMVQSSNYLMPGEELEIKAWVSAYSLAAKPSIFFNGQSIDVDEYGIGTIKFKVSGSGSKISPLTVSYTKPNGIKEAKTFEVKYTVGTPGGAAVMTDKMNVFYIGVDNPVTIGSPTGWDKTTVSMTKGTITGNGSARTVRVSTVGKSTITVNADNKLTTFEFRVKRIPDPVFKVGSGKVMMPSVEFKSQTLCRAELENFDFDLRFNVVSASVYFSGVNFSERIEVQLQGNELSSLSPYMQRCVPGSAITFDNVKVQGPDGLRSIEGKSIVLY